MEVEAVSRAPLDALVKKTGKILGSMQSWLQFK
jgi:hypothetical protein